jgi:DNA-directed RNA polymerase specialized sigma subunit
VQSLSCYTEIVDTLVAKLKRAGIPPDIDAEELQQVGYLEMLRVLRRTAPPTRIAIEKLIARRAKTAMLRHLSREARWRRRAIHVASYEEVSCGGCLSD